jgi:dTDP-4-dehydrorhamnose reductase
MKPTILLTGKNGQIGSELLRVLPGLAEVIAPDRRELDLLDPDSIRRIVREVRPQLIVNAAAYTAVDAAETDEANAYSVNAEAPALMAEEAKRLGAALLHYSTDYVFDGSKRAPYDETDPANPINVYGKTKLAGEQAVRNCNVPHLIIRTGWVYATRGRNFLLTILRLAAEREELRIVRDQVGSPTWSREIASSTAKILAQVIGQSSAVAAFSQVSGTYHMTAGGETTWYDFANSILEEAARVSSEVSWFAAATGGRPLVARRIIPIKAEEYPTSASRPAYSVLSNSLLTRSFGVRMSDWRTQLRLAFALECKAQHMAVADEP